MIDTGIKLSDMSTAWGLVLIVREDGTVEREYAISAAAADAVRDGKRKHPPGVTQEQWESGRVSSATRPLHPGLALRNVKDGSLLVNFGVHKVGNRIRTNLMVIPAGQWELVGRDGIRMLPRWAALVDVETCEVTPDVED